jgi:outer membrane protein assembly factor BamD
MSCLLKYPHNANASWLLALTMVVFFSGCSSTPEPTDSVPQDLSSTDEQIFVGDSIEMSYDPNVIMKRAESFFDKESYAEAIVEYNHFLNLHRNHIIAPYAQYKIGVSHYKQFQTVDRDPDPLNKAIVGFEKLLKDFPASRYEAEAKETILTCKQQLVQRHLMVGKFYFRREAYLAAAHRFEKIITDFPELDTAGEAIFRLAKTYQDLGIEEWTQTWLVELIRQYPSSPYYASAQTLLASIRKDHPVLLAALPPNSLPQESSTISPSSDATLPHVPDNHTVTHAGILPETTTHDTQDVVATVQTATPSSCTIGTWCESSSARPTQPIIHSTSSPSHAKVCKPGNWC